MKKSKTARKKKVISDVIPTIENAIPTIEDTINQPVASMPYNYALDPVQEGGAQSPIAGSGVMVDIVKSILPARNNYPPKVRRILMMYGEWSVINIVVCRDPVQKMVTKILNWISGGKLEEQIKKLHYDDLYHLYMIVTVLNPQGDVAKNILVEKNSTINMKVIPGSIKKPESSMVVPLNGKKITFGDMINDTQKAVGDKFYMYDHIDNNCQIFIRDILKVNGLLTPAVETFIMQDIEEVMKTSPAYANEIARFFNNLDAGINHTMEGGGVAVKSKLSIINLPSVETTTMLS